MSAIPLDFLGRSQELPVGKIMPGTLWYAPALFLKPWRKMTGITANRFKRA